MANEISLQIGLSCVNGKFSFPRIGTQTQITQSTIGGGGPGVITAVATGDGTAVDLSGMTNPGIAYFRNLDVGVRTVIIGTAGATGVGYLAKLRAGEETAIRLNNTMTSDTLYVKADAGICLVDIRVLED
jgi:hypothetical protein